MLRSIPSRIGSKDIPFPHSPAGERANGSKETEMSGDRMIRVDMTNQTASIEPFPDEWKLLGGRALSAKILLAECDPTCDALGPDNLLVIAPGTMAGTSAPTSRSHLDWRQEPAHRRHQGGQRGRQPGPGPDEARLPLHDREGQARRRRQALRRRRHRRLGDGQGSQRHEGHVELRPDRSPGQELHGHGVVHQHRTGGGAAAHRRVRRLHRPGAGAPPGPSRRARRSSAP